jgi:hypothetical protein
MHVALKVLVGGLALTGGTLIATVIASRFITIAVYSPWAPEEDIVQIPGKTIWKLAMKGGGKTKAKKARAIPFPLGLRVSVWKKRQAIF